ncbi:hypothetical protein HMPREF9015_00170 [Leptotrichia wadei F0279]|uniref:Uncharacterized protein n=1 Tax=Leptotrichia wadei (strain F0279) TaxID=888055 RepID=U2RKQ3_LEPWF|nr:hypothetical protein HMPREF9015_00170 [Leptotrichia wadei F0279]
MFSFYFFHSFLKLSYPIIITFFFEILKYFFSYDFLCLVWLVKFEVEKT